ncbi:hypothetical protein BDV93DRAFT_607742 [Ceratobasidium sp. AG-I]|nr:hypothetical protein BDV93DRAFT_607742 [Ceratobasidium sp. AG-I]
MGQKRPWPARSGSLIYTLASGAIEVLTTQYFQRPVSSEIHLDTGPVASVPQGSPPMGSVKCQSYPPSTTNTATMLAIKPFSNTDEQKKCEQQNSNGSAHSIQPTSNNSNPPSSPPALYVKVTTRDSDATITLSENDRPASSEKIPAHTPRCFPSFICLDDRFDELPAACFLSNIHRKTVCFYRYWSSAFNAGTCFSKNLDQPVIIPASLKENKLVEAGDRFTRSEAAVLLWPAHIPLPDIQGSHAGVDIQVIHIGVPLESNINTQCRLFRVVVSKTELVDLGTRDRTAFLFQYRLDPLMETLNERREGSALQPVRLWMRKSLAKVTFARGFYIGWINYHRIQNPSWSALELVSGANRYAEEVLLWGDSNNLNLVVRRRIPLQATQVKAMKLESAVDGGQLLVVA